jgi:uncharacterized membrane protein (UPF0136 family)
MNLKEVEKKIFASYFNDGLWDVYAGLLLLGFGLGIITGQTMVLIGFILLALIPPFVRKPLVMSRLGNVRFSPERQQRTIRYKVLAWVVGSIALLVGVVLAGLYSVGSMPAGFDAWMRDYFFVFIGGMLALIAGLTGYIINVSRFYLYALVVFGTFVAAALLRPNDLEGIPITAGGGLILLIGAIIFIRFLVQNPPPKGEDES